MARRPVRRLRVRDDRSGVGETYEALCALTVVIISVGLTLGAVHSATEQAKADASHRRAEIQADISLDALARDPALAKSPGVLEWRSASDVAAGRTGLSFLPSSVRVASLRSAMGGAELYLAGNATSLSSGLIFASRPVSIMTGPNTTEPGILRVGVAVP